MSLTRVMEGESLILMDGSKKILSIMEQQEEGKVSVILDGSLKTEVVHDFQDEMIALAIFGMDLSLDLAKVTYISSACIQIFLAIQQKLDDIGKGSLLLKNVPDAIMKELESTGMSELLMIEE